MRFLGTLLALGLAVAVTVPVLIASDVPTDQDRLWAHFTRHVRFADRMLPRGDYLFVHDDTKKAKGEPCLSVYAANDITEPLAAIHCVRKIQDPTERARIVWTATSTNELKEFAYIQFAGDSFAHYVP